MGRLLDCFSQTTSWVVATSLFCLFGVGCNSSSSEYATNDVLMTRLGVELGEPLGSDEVAETSEAIVRTFGRPQSPLIPDSVPSEVVSIENIQRASSAVYSDENDVHFGLYRKHCVRCHGTSGDGRGPAARMLAPYPRDFRLGKFKFKTTPIGTKPTRQDLARVLRAGIPGTSMPSFRMLKDEDIEALVDYVIFLSVRGETERALLTEVAYQGDYESPEPYADSESLSSSDQPVTRDGDGRDGDTLAMKVSLAQSIAVENFLKWKVVTPDAPARPTDFDGKSPLELADSISRGEEVFRSSVASCFQCHGMDGEGGRQPRDYDDWTKDWTIAVGIDPDDKAALKPFLKAGALKPAPISARDLRLGAFRGGSKPEDIYLRIVNGIEGTPMPAAALQPDMPNGLTPEQVWDLVNYCLSLSGGRY